MVITETVKSDTFGVMNNTLATYLKANSSMQNGERETVCSYFHPEFLEKEKPLLTELGCGLGPDRAINLEPTLLAARFSF